MCSKWMSSPRSRIWGCQYFLVFPSQVFARSVLGWRQTLRMTVLEWDRKLAGVANVARLLLLIGQVNCMPKLFLSAALWIQLATGQRTSLCKNQHSEHWQLTHTSTTELARANNHQPQSWPELTTLYKTSCYQCKCFNGEHFWRWFRVSNIGAWDCRISFFNLTDRPYQICNNIWNGLSGC